LPAPRTRGLANFDMLLFKQFPISESKKAEFRAEFFNLFNHTQAWPAPEPDHRHAGIRRDYLYGCTSARDSVRAEVPPLSFRWDWLQASQVAPQPEPIPPTDIANTPERSNSMMDSSCSNGHQ